VIEGGHIRNESEKKKVDKKDFREFKKVRSGGDKALSEKYGDEAVNKAQKVAKGIRSAVNYKYRGIVMFIMCIIVDRLPDPDMEDFLTLMLAILCMYALGTVIGQKVYIKSLYKYLKIQYLEIVIDKLIEQGNKRMKPVSLSMRFFCYFCFVFGVLSMHINDVVCVTFLTLGFVNLGDAAIGRGSLIIRTRPIIDENGDRCSLQQILQMHEKRDGRYENFEGKDNG